MVRYWNFGAISPCAISGSAAPSASSMSSVGGWKVEARNSVAEVGPASNTVTGTPRRTRLAAATSPTGPAPAMKTRSVGHHVGRHGHRSAATRSSRCRALVMMSRYFTISSAWNFLACSSGERRSAPRRPSRSRPHRRIVERAFSSLLSRSRIGCGVPAGAASANQPIDLVFGQPGLGRGRRVGQRRRAARRRRRRAALAPLALIGAGDVRNHWKPSGTLPAIRSGPYCAILR